ncbi:hypothetical protein CPB86DRAFT_788688 [Serendipita vermifera]|nr:hypothetical protein CPB86DRAFT_788688 [Serendipita vermifera]
MEEEYGREKKRRRVSTHLDSLTTTGMGPSGTSKTSTETSTIVSVSVSASVGGPADSFVVLLDEEALARSKKRLQAFSFL